MFTITKIKDGYLVGRRYPKENSIRNMRVKSLDVYEKMLGEDKMGLASFQRARRMAKEKAGKVNSMDVPQPVAKEEPKPQPKSKVKK